MDKLKKYIQGEDEETGKDTEGPSLSEQVNQATTFSYTTRIKGFIICFALGCAFSILGTFFLFIPKKGIVIFAVFYTVGNILSLASTCFLMGPCNQLKKMFAATRIVAVVVMFAFMVLTILSALVFKIVVLCVVFCICQSLALTWYSISYIPYARNVVKSMLCSCLK